MDSLRHIKPQDDEDGVPWQWRKGFVTRLWNRAFEDTLLTEETGREDFDVTGNCDPGDLV